MPALDALALKMALLMAPVSQEATLLFAGDAMQHSAQIDAARQGYEYRYEGMLDSVQNYIERADYAVVNLECPLGGAPYSGYPCFCAPDQYAVALKDAGFDMFLTANNHTLDRRDRGLRRTVAMLDSIGVDHIGTYSSAAKRKSSIPCIKDIKGFKIGFLNYTYGTNGITPAEAYEVDYIDTLAIKHDIVATRNAGAEIIALAIHWGDEYVLKPNQRQRQLADWLQQAGVELVIGSHPHVIQPMELRRDEADSLKRCLVVYSLGNFISNMKTTDTRGGAMVHVTLRRTPDGRPFIHRAAYAPVYVSQPHGNQRNFILLNATKPIQDNVDESRRQAFIHNALEVFNRHNIEVPIHNRYNYD